MPALLVIDEDQVALAGTREQLRRRYGADYQIFGEPSPGLGLVRLKELTEAGEHVALVLAAQWMDEMTGTELLSRVPATHPSAKRGLLIDWGSWGDAGTANAIFEAMALNRIDYYVLRPEADSDELFHRTVTEFLQEWARGESPAHVEIELVGDPAAPRTHELKSLLGRNGVPHTFHAAGSPSGSRLLSEVGEPRATVPIARVRDGQVLVDPSNVEIANAFGVSTELDEEHEFDVAVVGAGPAGLATAVYASSEGLRALVVEREAIGGQAGSSSLIRNYLGFSRGVSGAELAQRAYQQAWVFGTSFLLMREVTELVPGERRHLLRISGGAEVTARAVVLACGASYRRLEIPRLANLEGAGVFYGASGSEAKALTGRNAVIVGGGNSAGQAAMHLCRYAKNVTLVVRGEALAATMSSYLRGVIEAADNIDVLVGTEVIDGDGEGRLETLTLRDRRLARTSTVDADALFIMIGASPGTGWLPGDIERDEWGYVVTGRDSLETSLPRVFAVGDVRRGSAKRVAAAVGEGSVVIRQILESIEAEAQESTPSSGAKPGRRNEQVDRHVDAAPESSEVIR